MPPEAPGSALMAAAATTRVERGDIAQLGIICRNSRDAAWYEVSTGHSRSVRTAAGACLQVAFRAHVPVEPDLVAADELPSRVVLQPVPASALSCLLLQPGTRVLALDVTSLASSRYIDAVVKRRVGRDVACPQGRCQCSFIVQAQAPAEGPQLAAGSPHPVMHTIHTLCWPGKAATQHPAVQRWAHELQPPPAKRAAAGPPTADKGSPRSASSSPTSSSTTATISDPASTPPTSWHPPALQPPRALPSSDPPDASDAPPSPTKPTPARRTRKRTAAPSPAPPPGPDPQLTKGQADAIVSRLHIPDPTAAGRAAPPPALPALPPPGGSSPRHTAPRPPVHRSILPSLPSRVGDRPLGPPPNPPRHLDLSAPAPRAPSPSLPRIQPASPPQPPANLVTHPSDTPSETPSQDDIPSPHMPSPTTVIAAFQSSASVLPAPGMPSPAAVIAAFQSSNSVLPSKCAPSPDACHPPSRGPSPRPPSPPTLPVPANIRPVRPLPVRAPSAAATHNYSSTPTTSPSNPAFQRLVSDPALLTSLSMGARHFTAPTLYPPAERATSTTPSAPPSAAPPPDPILLCPASGLTYLRTSAPTPYQPPTIFTLTHAQHSLLLRAPVAPAPPPAEAPKAPPCDDPRFKDLLLTIHRNQEALDDFEQVSQKPAPGFNAAQWGELRSQIRFSRELSFALIREVAAAAVNQPAPQDAHRPDAPPLRRHASHRPQPQPHPDYPPAPTDSPAPTPAPLKPHPARTDPDAPNSDPRSNTTPSRASTPTANGGPPPDPTPQPAARPRKSPPNRYTVPMVVPRPPASVPPPVAYGGFWTPPAPQPPADSTTPSSSPEPEDPPSTHPHATPSSTPRASPSPPPFDPPNPSADPARRALHPHVHKHPHTKRTSHTGTAPPSRLGTATTSHKRSRDPSPHPPTTTTVIKRARRTNQRPASPRPHTDPRPVRPGDPPAPKAGPPPGAGLQDAPDTADAIEGLLQLAESVPIPSSA